MKTLTTLLLTFLISSVYSQNYWEYNIDFEDTSQFFRLEIDTNSNSNNIWQIGVPQKTIFTSAYSAPNAILTDTINPYPENDTSMFIVKHVADLLGGFYYEHTVILSGKYQVDSDSLLDFGVIEFSPDNGVTWVNLLTDTLYLNQWCYEWWWGKPTLSGNSNGWSDFYVWLAGFGSEFNILPGDTVQYRFTFVSDSINNNRDGLMFDDLHFEDWADGIKNINNQFASKSYPNPTEDILTIEFENVDNSLYEIAVFDGNGQQILTKKTTNQNKLELNLKDYKSGIYYYKVTDLKNGQIAFGKIVKQ